MCEQLRHDERERRLVRDLLRIRHHLGVSYRFQDLHALQSHFFVIVLAPIPSPVQRRNTVRVISSSASAVLAVLLSSPCITTKLFTAHAFVTALANSSLMMSLMQRTALAMHRLDWAVLGAGLITLCIEPARLCASLGTASAG